ncbi:class I SAM-dependent methyltransferase [Lactococcus sp.]|uniref:class I SAM-dependent methyltransferase n=1 Tax=Lactococcus sp. TaxID=44273 RepID=UPI0035AE06B9
MNEKLKSFYDQQDTPWMQLFYKLVYAQLPDLDGQKILDFGAGFGWTANYLAGKGQHKNQLLALEPNAEMLANRLSENDYEMRMGGLLLLEKLPDATFDFIVCHNVLEYCPDERSKILSELTRVLKKGGTLSIVKHHFTGSIMQRIVFENALDEAYDLLEGSKNHHSGFGTIDYYDLEKLIKNLPLRLVKKYGIGAFNRLQPNAFKFSDDWKEKMFKLEMACSERSEYRDIAFFHHDLLIKK